MSRPDRDTFWFRIAADYATRATCPRASIGAVLVKFDRLISAGFNGAAPGEPHCLERDQTLEQHLALRHCDWALHAERNALRNAFIPADGSTLYVVGPRPVCPNCRDYLSSRGVNDIRHKYEVATLDSVLAEVVEWGRATFPSSTDATKTLHLIEEVQELHEAPDDPMEMADVVMILAHLAAAKGVNLAEAVAAKLAICRTRTWAPPDERGVIKAVKAVTS